MYISPGTAVRLLRNIPLDSTYNHTIYFGSRSAANLILFQYGKI